MRKIIIFGVMLALLACGVLAINPHTPQASGGIGSNELTIENPKAIFYPQGTLNELHFHVWNSTGYNVVGANTTCKIHIYNSTGHHLIDAFAIQDGDDPMDYEVTLGTNITDYAQDYPYIIYCTWLREAGFVSDFFEIAHSNPENTSVSGFPLATLILIPLLFGILLLIGSFIFGEEHAVLKIILFLMAYLTVFLSLWFGLQTVVRYYGFTDLQEAIGTTTWIIGIVFFVILSYFLIYAFIKGVETAAQKKEKRLEY